MILDYTQSPSETCVFKNSYLLFYCFGVALQKAVSKTSDLFKSLYAVLQRFAYVSIAEIKTSKPLPVTKKWLITQVRG